MPFKSAPPLYSIWHSMKQRCTNPNSASWDHYGGRGIKVCDRWMQSYSDFAADMSPRPEGTSLDRIDNNKGYSPDNCRWATRREQQRNRRNTVVLRIHGVDHLLCDLVEKSGATPGTIKGRVNRGCTYEQVIDETKRTLREWSEIGRKKWSEAARTKTHCPEGHEFTEQNRVARSDAWNVCRICYNARKLRELHARKAKERRLG